MPTKLSNYKTIYLLFAILSVAIKSNAQVLDKADTVWFSCSNCIPLNSGEQCFALLDTNRFTGSPFFKEVPNRDKTRGINIHGTVNYEFIYRSRIDTPFQQEDFQQHIVRGHFKTKLLQDVPVQVNIAAKTSNSSYFRNTLDIDVGFDPRSYKKGLEDKLTAQLRDKMQQYYHLSELEQQYKQQLTDAANWNQLLSRPGFSSMLQQSRDELAERVVQRLQQSDSTLPIEEAYRAVNDFLDGKQVKEILRSLSLKDDSASTQYEKVFESYATQAKELVELEQKSSLINNSNKLLYQKIDSVKRVVNDSVAVLKSKLNQVKSGKELDDLIQKNKLSKDSISKTQRMIAGLRSFHIGRSGVNYTELTIRNISVTGLNMSGVYGPYIAVAGGYIDYRYRDFIIRNQSRPRQWAIMGRLGLSGREDKGLFITGFTGKREIFSTTANTVKQEFPISGYSLQYLLPLGGFGTLSGELAKSTTPQYRQGGANGGDGKNSLVDFSERGNEAYAFSYIANFSRTHTKVNLAFRKTGSDFQSLAGYNYNANQTSYSGTIVQAFFREQIGIKLGVKKNEFVYPYLTNLSSNMLLKTAQLTFKRRKWPTVVAGYYPSTQLVMLPGDEVAEYSYNTFSVSTSYQYKLLGLSHSSMLLYSKFYNRSSDSAFMYFNSSYWSCQHVVLVFPFTVQVGYTLIGQQTTTMTTLESSLSFVHRTGFSVAGGFKWNRLNHQDVIGGNARVAMPLKKLGMIQISYELSSLPAWQEELLVPVSSGRVIYSKTF